MEIEDLVWLFINHMKKDCTGVVLSPRLIEIIKLLSQGYVCREIAAELNISTKTAHAHLTKLKEKLRANNVTELVSIAVRGGLIHLEPVSDSFPALTRRQTEIVKLLCEGYNIDEVAEILNISPKTVGNHYHNTLDKLRFHSRQELVYFAFRTGLVQ